MLVESVVFESIPEPLPEFEEYQMRVYVHGSEPDERAIPFVVRVGELRVEMLVPIIGQEGIEGVQGMLAGIPLFGDEVLVGYAGQPLRPTGFTFSETVDA